MPPTLAERLRAAAARLAPHSQTPRLDAELLLAHALGCSRAQLLAQLRETASARDFEDLIARRAAHEPIAYILGEWEFFSLEFAVRAPILVPRPETEHLVEAALEFLDDGPARVFEWGVGTGCVAVTIARHRPRARVWGVDRRAAAVALARENAARHGVRLALHCGDGFHALPPGAEPFDLIVSNPPYVEEAAWRGLARDIREHEDPGALIAGPEGLDAIRVIINEAPARLRRGGMLALEIGDTQFEAVAALLGAAGFVNIHARRDLAGIQRIVAGARA